MKTPNNLTRSVNVQKQKRHAQLTKENRLARRAILQSATGCHARAQRTIRLWEEECEK